jgi:hypothetical protein
MNFTSHTIAALVLCTVPMFAHSATLLDLDADDLAQADGSTVTSWGIATGSGTPTYRTNQTPGGFAAVEFNGSDHFGTLSAVNFPASASGDLIFAGLIKATNIGAYHNIIDDAASNRPMLWIDTAFRFELNYSYGSTEPAAGTGVDGWDVFIANSRTNELFINSATANGGGGSAVAYNFAEGFDLFNRNGGQTFQGLVADLRVYNSTDDFGGDYGALYTDLSSKLSPVPVPASLPLLLAGIGLFAGIGRRAKRS